MQPSQLESTAVRQKLAVRNNNGSSKISLPPLPGFTGAEIKDSALTQRHKKTDMSRLRTKSHSTSSRTNDFAVNNETRDKLQINLPGIELNNRGVLKLPKIGETRIDPQSRRRSSSTPVKSHRESTYSQRGSISGAVIAGILGCSGGGSVSRNRFSRYGTVCIRDELPALCLPRLIMYPLSFQSNQGFKNFHERRI